jgi:phosphoribosylaminoimidazolecarboxamide formyltransferase / IMP cyclohydrolase
MIKTALISVSNKEHIEEFAKQLSKLGVKIISTGNTAKILKEKGIDVREVSEITKFPEMLNGRVKSLHPNIFAGILADRKKHLNELKKLNIDPIDIVIVNFYPFVDTVKKTTKKSEIIENIDIGGPSLVRAAAKNHKDVLVVVDPADYEEVIEHIKNNKLDETYREKLATKAFLHTARYDIIIGRYFSEEFVKDSFPEIYNFTFRRVQDLRYGENPHQKAAFYRAFWVEESCIATAKQLHGKEMSYNNILDANDAFELVKDFKEPTAAVIKHTNPSGVATSSTITEAYKKAYENDPKSAFGGIIALNRDCNLAIAKQIRPIFVEIVICPKFDEDALKLLKEKKNVRLLETGPIKRSHKGHEYRRVVGGLLVQSREPLDLIQKDLKVVTKRKPTKEEMGNMIFAWRVNKYTKSNGIILAKNNISVGVGAGQMSRVDAVKLAVMKSEGKSKGSVMSSDAYFPFRDGIDEAAKAGVTAIIQPGGSIRDEEVIKAADEHNIAMVFSGLRLFLH